MTHLQLISSRKKVPVKLCNKLSQEDRIINSTAIKFVKQHF